MEKGKAERYAGRSVSSVRLQTGELSCEISEPNSIVLALALQIVSV